MPEDSSYGSGPALEIDIVGGIPESRAAEQQHRATDGMSGSERFAAGVGKSLVDTGEGARQFLGDMPGLGFSAVSSGVLGLLKGQGFTEGMVNGLAQMGRERQEMRQSAADRREGDRDLTSTGAGLSGNVAGTIAQILGPGALARGTAAAPAILPTTIRGNALQGGVIGAVQPNTGAQDRGLNMLLGGLGGGAGAGLVKVAGATASGLGNLLARTGLSGTDRRAAELVAREATSPNALTYQQSAVPGVRLTLGESTQDAGLMALENAMRARNRGAFEAIDQSNNAARVGQLERIAGTDADMAAAEAARSDVVAGRLGEAMREGADSEARQAATVASERAAAQAARDAAVLENTRLSSLGLKPSIVLPEVLDTPAVSEGLKSLRSTVGDIQAANATRPSVQSAVNDVARSLDRAGDSVASLYGSRKYIGDLLEGKAGPDKGYAKAATRELMQIRDALDEQLAQRAPSFPEYLQAYRQASKPINRMEVGREVLQRSSGAVPDQLGNPVLTPAGVMRATGDLDAIAAKATGFKKARAADILSAEDVSAIRAIQQDMVRQANRQRSGTAGSQTAERLAIGDRIAKQSLATRIPWAGQFFEHFEAKANEQLQERLAFMMANPQEAKRVLAALPEKDRAPVRAMLGQLAMASGRSAGAQRD
ncbi:hypothetical protein [Stenotrophomonas sp. UBA7606]|uniref:hypothetical protein n=1 Tax=Stenotrophomonas sp. UBA7606 TaxID=1947559 RepID=UPI0025E31699|nr:hypothetical protein [Stenotrophomonas sp. UBA7606]